MCYAQHILTVYYTWLDVLANAWEYMGCTGLWMISAYTDPVAPGCLIIEI